MNLLAEKIWAWLCTQHNSVLSDSMETALLSFWFKYITFISTIRQCRTGRELERVFISTWLHLHVLNCQPC